MDRDDDEWSGVPWAMQPPTLRELLTDATTHAPGVSTLPSRTKTTAMLLHRIGVSTTVAGTADFFLRDPEGVATLHVRRAERLEAIRDWRREGIPQWASDRAYVPYHILVDPTGVAHQMLPLEAKSAHAGFWNGRSIAVAAIGDFRPQRARPLESRTPIRAEQVRTVDAVLRALRRERYSEARLLRHDDAKRERGEPVKGCPGALWPWPQTLSAVG